MNKIIKKASDIRNIKNTGIIIFISFLHFFVSAPFSLIPATHINNDDIKAFWQPPGMVFGIVWPILYALLGIISLYCFYSKNISIKCKNKIIISSIIEAVAQAFWLISFGRYFNLDINFGRYGCQYYISCFIIFILMIYAWSIRLPLLKKCNFKLHLLYLPYAIWITFAFILNAQILYIYLKM
ncbi:MAG: tryptophan-rich sensory protein [Bacteroidetes bacterium]|nr:tryptophan-rich sensory protein [Bacteroidota bacterium]